VNLLLAGAGAAVFCFAQGFVRLRRRGRADHASWARAALFALGLAAAIVPLLLPLDGRLSTHMLEHVLVGDVAPALVLVALRGPLLVFCVPQALHGLRHALAPLLRPAVALGVWMAALAAWHVPAAYEYALHHPAAHELEHASFALGGVLVWVQLIDPARRRRLSAVRRLAFAGVLFGCGQLLGDVLFLTKPLYASYPTASDQQGAALVMMAEQTLVLGTFAALLAWSRLRQTAGKPAVRSAVPSARIANAS